MSKLTTYTQALTLAQAEVLKQKLAAKNYEWQEKPYCLYAAKGVDVTIAVYEKGPKVVVQGKGTEDWVRDLLEPEVLGVAELGYEEVHHPERFEPHIGVDESGKGDYFGPLVIAGVYAEADGIRALVAAGVADSKKLSDGRVRQIAGSIRRLHSVRSEVIAIQPERYNELYDKMGNLNALLAWGHARVIENLLERAPQCRRALSDQFANPKVLKRALLERGRSIELVQRTKAESDPVVAAASILAREAFLSGMEQLAAAIGTRLPKGASTLVKETAAGIVGESGLGALRKVAKVHFKTTADVMGGQK